MQKTLKILFIVAILSTIILPAIGEADTSSWLTETLQKQREIDINAPLNEATFIGTHNSYNALAYQWIPIRYLDPNQKLSLYDQLEQGIRSIELDAHWTINNHFKKEILLCHAYDNHFGCSPFDMPISLGFQEIRKWLLRHPNEVVLLYIERHLEGHDRELAESLKSDLGEFIYPTTAVKDKPSSCTPLPTQISKATILKAKKQLIVVTKNCDTIQQAAESWQQLIFTGIGEIPTNPFSFIDATVTAFEAYPHCSKTTFFAPDIDHTSLWRIFEDRTKLTNILHPQKHIRAADVRELLRCGINWPTLDMLERNDERLEASIWSWAKAYPKEDAGNCASYRYSQGIVNLNCREILKGFACIHASQRTLQAIAWHGLWRNGETACQTVAGPAYHFAVPVNAAQMEQLKQSMHNLGLTSIWLNYALDSRGRWAAYLQ